MPKPEISDESVLRECKRHFPDFDKRSDEDKAEIQDSLRQAMEWEAAAVSQPDPYRINWLKVSDALIKFSAAQMKGEEDEPGVETLPGSIVISSMCLYLSAAIRAGIK